jgi:hypothetical protein
MHHQSPPLAGIPVLGDIGVALQAPSKACVMVKRIAIDFG